MAWTTTLTSEHTDQRVDRLLATFHPHLGRAGAARLCGSGAVRLDGRRVGKAALGVAGAVLAVDEVPVAEAVSDHEVALVEAYVDAALVVVDKPAGMASHPLRPGELGTVASALLARYPEMRGIGYGPREAGLVHRLDTGTSGLLVAARSEAVFQRLRVLLVAGQIEKHYRALCAAPVAPCEVRGWLDATGRRVRILAEPGPSNRPIRMEILSSHPQGAWWEVEVRVAHAGRHQVRAQLAALGAPLVGDGLYGGPAVEGLEHHCLHASRLAFAHPETGAWVEVQSAPRWFSAERPVRS